MFLPLTSKDCHIRTHTLSLRAGLTVPGLRMQSTARAPAWVAAFEETGGFRTAEAWFVLAYLTVEEPSPWSPYMRRVLVTPAECRPFVGVQGLQWTVKRCRSGQFDAHALREMSAVVSLTELAVAVFACRGGV